MRYCDGLTKLQFLFAVLDMLLTGKPWAVVLESALQKAITLNKLVENNLYYLADGGYSRLVVNRENYELSLTSDSRDEVKNRWPCVRGLVEDVTDLMILDEEKLDV